MRLVMTVMTSGRRGVFALIIGMLMITAPLALWGHDPRTITRIATERKVIALTIDDGPHYKTTPEVLRILKQKQVRATFFILGLNAVERPDLVAQAAADGHEIALHGYHHHALTALSPAQIRGELELAEKTIAKAVPVRPTLFRPPGGDYNNTVLTAAREKGYTVVLWNIDPKDWSRPPVQSVVDTVVRAAMPGSIVLLHDGQYPLPTPQAIAIFVDRLRQQGYEFVTVSDLLQMQEHRSTWLPIR